jgi:hypothetical protein
MASSGIDLVQVSPNQSRTPKQKSRNCYTCHSGSNPICHDKSLRIFELHGNNGGLESIRKVGEVVHYGSDKELDGVAVRTAYQLPICSTRTSIILVQAIPLGWNCYLSYINSF